MTDLMNTLYEFLPSYNAPGVWSSPEYANALDCAKRKKEQLESQLNKRQLQLLEDLLRELQLAGRFDREYIFQAALALSRELAGLVRPS